MNTKQLLGLVLLASSFAPITLQAVRQLETTGKTPQEIAEMKRQLRGGQPTTQPTQGQPQLNETQYNQKLASFLEGADKHFSGQFNINSAEKLTFKNLVAGLKNSKQEAVSDADYQQFKKMITELQTEAQKQRFTAAEESLAKLKNQYLPTFEKILDHLTQLNDTENDNKALEANAKVVLSIYSLIEKLQAIPELQTTTKNLRVLINILVDKLGALSQNIQKSEQESQQKFKQELQQKLREKKEYSSEQLEAIEKKLKEHATQKTATPSLFQELLKKAKRIE